MTLKILEPAQDDLLQGFLFYEGQQPGVGTYFLDSIMAEIDSLVLFAGTHPIRNGFHRMLSARFPFAIYYRLAETELIVRAVLDCRQDPDAIRERLR